MMHPKPTRWQSKKYEDWIKTQPCYRCGSPSEPHHVKGIGNLSGGALKAESWACIPLCHAHHRELHDTPEMWGEQWEMVARTLGAAIRGGVLR